MQSGLLKILSATQMREADAFTIRNEPVSSVDLMERAAGKCADWILKHFEKRLNYYIFCGSGNNGGDGLVIARLLRQQGCHVKVFIICYADHASDDFTANEMRLKRLLDQDIQDVTAIEHLPEIPEGAVVIDAVFGTGLSREADGLAAACIKQMNNCGGKVVSIDLPSGLFADRHTRENASVVKASYTLSFQCPKLAFMYPENAIFAGEWIILDIGLSTSFIENEETAFYVLSESYIRDRLKSRKKFSHKGDYGHALLVAGKYGSMGAAVLAARACLKSGAGLLTVHVPVKGVEVLQISAPEAIISVDEDDAVFSKVPELKLYTTIGAGPGIGQSESTQKALLQLLEHYQKPMVLDADALNIIGANAALWDHIPANSILTPHPKEFERLLQKSSDHFERHSLQIECSKQYKVYILLKGAHSCLTTPEGDTYFNTTGNPGMAKGGSGDVLTGLITGFLAQGYSSLESAQLGMYIHGMSGDSAKASLGEHTMTATDLIEHFSQAFLALNEHT